MLRRIFLFRTKWNLEWERFKRIQSSKQDKHTEHHQKPTQIGVKIALNSTDIIEFKY